MDNEFVPELLIPGYYMLCPLRNGRPVKEGLTKVECPQCGRDCVVDLEHAQSVRWQGLQVKCLHCVDPMKTPTPDNPPKK